MVYSITQNTASEVTLLIQKYTYRSSIMHYSYHSTMINDSLKTKQKLLVTAQFFAITISKYNQKLFNKESVILQFGYFVIFLLI